MFTRGINHTGLSVRNLDETVAFFTQVLGWEESGRDESYPRSAVGDGTSRLTLWQVSDSRDPVAFDRRHNIGLHHLAIAVPDEATLNMLADKVAAHPGVDLRRFHRDVPELLATVDSVVGMAGYNTVVELLASRRKGVLCPRQHPRREQELRARRILIESHVAHQKDTQYFSQ